MKSITIKLLLLLFIGLPLSSRACDICGCGVGSYYIGILPQFNKRFVGVRYQYKSLQTHLGPTGNRTPISAEETYQSLELWGAWNLGSRWRIMAIVPYNFNARNIPGSGEVGRMNGLGDIVVYGYYKIFEQMGSTKSNQMFNHSLWVGAGVKAPSGKYDPAQRSAASQDAPNNFQLGTASTDFMINLAYDIRVMDLGLNTNVSYKMNTENKYDYRYGNKLSVNSLLYYKVNIKDRVRLSPNAGVGYETQPKDVSMQRYDVAQSGGYSLAEIAGIEVNIGKVNLGANYQTLLSQKLADGRAKAGGRWLTHISYSF
ncbi:transporter [Sphingobacterium thalpophilum]|uniref:transporter n=1 Tax=Sphingobacterium thalpophilum TaxID=259 RepID=UPI003DA47B55